jgi:hypothetical protein
LKKIIIITILSLAFVQCGSRSVNSSNETPYSPTETIAFTPTILSPQVTNIGSVNTTEGCTSPPIQISSLNIRHFYWSADSKSILFKEKDEQIWYSYNIIAGQTIVATNPASETSIPEYTNFNLSNYQDAFISPSGKLIVFTRIADDEYKIFYKTLNDDNEHYLGIFHGVIDKVDWLNDERQAIISLDWQGSPRGVSAYVYITNFTENTFVAKMPVLEPYENVQYLGLTPDKTHFMFVTYDGNPTVRLWNIATDEVSITPMFNPRNFHWISEYEIISVNPNRDKLFFVDILLYNIVTRETNYLAKGEFEIEPFLLNSLLISPDGTSVAYIENKTDNLYWTKCIR